jgi:hypothetical protein
MTGKNAKLTIYGEVQTRNGNEKISLIKGKPGLIIKLGYDQG